VVDQACRALATLDAPARVAELPVLEIASWVHMTFDLTNATIGASSARRLLLRLLPFKMSACSPSPLHLCAQAPVLEFCFLT
jgi:hypothetical protein